MRARKNPKIFSVVDPEYPKQMREKKNAAMPKSTQASANKATNVPRTAPALEAGAAPSAVLDGVPEADTDDDEDGELPPVRLVSWSTPGEPAGRAEAAAACEEVGAKRPGDPAGRDEEVDAPENITLLEDPFVAAGGT